MLENINMVLAELYALTVVDVQEQNVTMVYAHYWERICILGMRYSITI